MTRYRIDPEGSKVSIDARSSLHPIHSDTTGVQGWFEADLLGEGRLDPEVKPRAQLEFPVDGLSSGNPLYDREMRRRVDARHHPLITGELTSMKATGSGGCYEVSGEVTFRGETKLCTDEMRMSLTDEGAVRLEGSHTFDIRDFGMQPPRILSLRVYPDVTVRVSILARAEGSI